MFDSPTSKILVTVSEQVFEPMQVPIIIGNAVYMVIQQDVRKIEDSRHLYFKQLSNDNNINNCNQNNINNSQIFDAINNAYKLREERTSGEQEYNQNLQNLIRNNISTTPIEMQIDLEKQSFNNHPIIKCEECMCSQLTQPSFVQHCKKVFRCRGVNTETVFFNCDNSENICESLSARDQLKKKKEYQDTIGI